MLSLWTLLWGFGTSLVVLLGWGCWRNLYFRIRGIKGPPAYLPFIGNTLNVFTKSKHFVYFEDDNYKTFTTEKYIGVMRFFSPIVTVRDPELIKQICIKDFDHFLDHQGTSHETADLFGRVLFALQGQKWRDMRATLSPAFTSSKMRGMFQFVVDCGEQMANYYIEQMEIPENKVRGLIELEMKDAFSRYTNDVIATCAFGLSVNSFTDKENEFYVMAKDASDFSGPKLMRFIFMLVFPKLAKILGVEFLSMEVSNFLRKIVWDTVKDRESRNVIRHDMIHLLMEARKGTLKHETPDGKEGFATVEESSIGKTIVKREWEDDDIVAQAVIFLAAGLDTSSSLACFVAHELALHPEIQKKLQQEIDEVMAASTNEKFTYECLQKMTYMDMVVSETLRLWPPSGGTDRKIVKDYTLPPPNDQSKEGLKLRVGDGLTIPIYSIHHDPKYFTNPEVFDPERFSDENKHNVQPGTYLPFGIGPRNCIGSRFALMEVKAIIFYMLLKFDVVTTAKTQHPIKLKTGSIGMHAEKGFWLGLKPRVK